jgi:uncharacterized protein YlxW (UPF0749 family)
VQEPAEEGPRSFVSTSLFVDITTITVDPSYVAAAARRAADPAAKPARTTSLLAVGTLLAVGGLWGVAARQTRDRAPAAERIRTALAAEAEQRAAATDRLARQEAELRRQTAAAREAQLRQSAASRALADEVARLELAVGSSRVRGPGLVVTLTDSPDPEEGTRDGRVSDSDIQAVVNALWAAGAEAVAVNDERISTLTTIRLAGDAILVHHDAVVPPYVIRAIGDPDVLDPAFNGGPVAQRYRTFADLFGLGFEVARAERLELPATDGDQLRHAAPAKERP